MDMVTPGQVLAGKFQVERVLGQGGMGVVVSAYHLVLGQRVALKFLLPEAMQHPEAVERFLREARAAVRLKSEHVGRVIDVGTLDNGAPYIVMEFLEGGDLSQFVQRNGSLPVAAAVDFLLQACEAIAEAHALGIVHRDLKPANLFITRNPDGSPLVKVLDFGISKAATTDQDFSLTRTSAVMGSPGYMSPEQLRSTRDVDARSDIWALGVILYELTSGRQPFVADSITELALKVAMDPLPPLYAPQLPPGFSEVVSRCLEKDAGRRYQNVAELAVALAPFGPNGSYEAAERIARVLRVQVTGGFQRPGSVGMGMGGGNVGTGPQQAPTTLSGSAAQTYGGGATGVGGPKKKTGLIVGIAVGVAVAAGVAIAVVAGGGSKGGGGGGGSASGQAAAQPAAPTTTTTTTTSPSPSTSPTTTTTTPTTTTQSPPVQTPPVASGSGSASDVASGNASGSGSASGSEVGSGSASGSAVATVKTTGHTHKTQTKTQTKTTTTKTTTTTTTPKGSDDDFSNSRY
ncbi:MAG TPA: serine/threonine-protein kinase [Kofleriaceae bacterium]|nr:serine/threonine-protein kinase [Kofleriaceae bacterium]